MSRFAPDPRFRREAATLLATALHLLNGTPFIYQGEEIGTTNTSFAAFSDFHDLESIDAFDELPRVQGSAPGDALDRIRFRSRDNARTPMQRDAFPDAGFTTGEPWSALHPGHAEGTSQRKPTTRGPCSTMTGT